MIGFILASPIKSDIGLERKRPLDPPQSSTPPRFGCSHPSPHAWTYCWTDGDTQTRFHPHRVRQVPRMPRCGRHGSDRRHLPLVKADILACYPAPDHHM